MSPMAKLSGKARKEAERAKSARTKNAIFGTVIAVLIIAPALFFGVNLYLAKAVTAAPAWSAVTTDDASITSADLAGDVYVMDFFFIDCGICKEQMPHNRKLVEAFADRDDFTFISVTADPKDTVERINAHRATDNASWPHVRDEFGLYRDFDVTGNPHLAFVDRDGNVALILQEIATGPRLILEAQALLDGARVDGPPRVEGRPGPQH